jgi:hypothetical protein
MRESSLAGDTALPRIRPMSLSDPLPRGRNDLAIAPPTL